MELISLSLSALDNIFSNRSVAPGEPHCPKATNPVGLMRESWQKWLLIYMETLSVEDIYIIVLMLIGFILSGFAFAWLNWKLHRNASVNDIERQLDELKDLKASVNDWFADLHHKAAGSEELLHNIATHIENIQEKTDALMSQLAEQLPTIISMDSKLDEMARALAAVEIRR